MYKKAVVFFADGMEECEALITQDILNRAGAKAISASINVENKVASSHNVVIEADILASEINYDQISLLVLPGGVPGYKHLYNNPIVVKQCRRFAESNKLLAAICAAPSVLGKLGLLNGKNATCHPGFEENLLGAHIHNKSVVIDNNIITAQALGATMPFAFTLVEKLLGKQAKEDVINSIYYQTTA